MKRYPSYKDSGIDWIGEVPDIWRIKKTKYLFSLRNGEAAKEERGGDFSLYGANGVIGEYPYCNINERKIIIGRVGASGEVNIAEKRSWISDNALIVNLNKGQDFQYVYYLLKSINFPERTNKTAQPLITAGFIGNFFVPCPEHEEQKAIADFLDLKTAQIDDLIAKKERMIELLKEERTAIINQAVTKGIDSNVGMKDSGIEWLGKVPKHWEIKRLKYVANINPQRPDGIPDETKVVFMAMESMNADGTYDNSIVRPYSEVKTGFTYFAEDDVVFAKITPCFENGKGAMLRNLGSDIGFGSTEFHVLRAVKSKTIPEYLYFLTISGLFRELGKAFMQGVAGQKRVTNNFVQDFVIGVPSVNEQKAVSSFLGSKIKQIDAQIGREEKSIEYLKEYRTALISEVVTGKIDVREA